jgi:hypothetical protein
MLCKRGKEAAKAKFSIYPSAYANAFASRVCLGKAKDARGERFVDKAYSAGLAGRSELERWFDEKWVNVCAPKPYPACGRGKPKLMSATYPYCRPMIRVNSKTPKTVRELGPKKLKQMCRKKKTAMKRHRGKSPTRIAL